MIIDKFVTIKGHPRNFSFYKNLGYSPEIGKEFDVTPNHIKPGSPVIINCKCDNCDLKISMEYRFYFSYTKGLSEPYYCISCKSIKSKKTNITKYGFDNPMKSDLVKNTLKKSIMNKYGVAHYSKTDEYKDKYKKTCINKYGVDNISKLDTMKSLISEIKFKELNSIDKHRNIIPEDYNILEYLPNRNFKILHRECNSEFSIFIGTLNDRTRNGNIICTNCNPVDKLSSGRELELSNFLKEYNIEFISNSYEIIPPLSLDIYIPDLNLAFEFNGVYWHSEVYKDKYYHLNKSKKCKEIGIDLTHIWEDDWLYKKDIIKSIILNKLGKTKNKIWARKCQVREIEDISTVRNFLNNNHIQGYSNSQKKLGLYYNGELVSLMIFGKRKKNIELIRFCNKLNFSIIGGSSKLFKYYINNYKFDIIESYSDSSIFDGNMYEKLGFKFKYNTPINYWRVVDGIRKHRFNFNKKKLVSMGYDINLSENEILTNLKYYRIWGCGLKKWIFEKS